MMGRPLTPQMLTRMRTLLFDHDLTAPTVAKRLGVSERVVQVYRQQWLIELRTAEESLKSVFLVR